MSDNCCGTHVPAVPERPFDPEQPAFVLVDGKWIDLGEVIERYLPPVPDSGPVLQIKHFTMQPSDFPTIPQGGLFQLQPTMEVVPRAANSRLVAIANVPFTIQGTAPGIDYMDTRAHLRYQTSTGVWNSGATGQRGAYDRRAPTSISSNGITTLPFQLNLGASQRRSDDSKWAIATWVQCDNNRPTYAAGDLNVLVIEYLEN